MERLVPASGTRSLRESLASSSEERNSRFDNRSVRSYSPSVNCQKTVIFMEKHTIADREWQTLGWSKKNRARLNG
jgi:hypothetical protein